MRLIRAEINQIGGLRAVNDKTLTIIIKQACSKIFMGMIKTVDTDHIRHRSAPFIYITQANDTADALRLYAFHALLFSTCGISARCLRSYDTI